eukprot:scaffold266_cov248-Pinguiococcus_pyrenoidosus.AAC.22
MSGMVSVCIRGIRVGHQITRSTGGVHARGSRFAKIGTCRESDKAPVTFGQPHARASSAKSRLVPCMLRGPDWWSPGRQDFTARSRKYCIKGSRLSGKNELCSREICVLKWCLSVGKVRPSWAHEVGPFSRRSPNVGSRRRRTGSRVKEVGATRAARATPSRNNAVSKAGFCWRSRPLRAARAELRCPQARWTRSLGPRRPFFGLEGRDGGRGESRTALRASAGGGSSAQTGGFS